MARAKGVARYIRSVGACGLLLAVSAAQAQNPATVQSIPQSSSYSGGAGEGAFDAYLRQVRASAVAQGVRPATVDAAFAGLTLNQRVIDLDRPSATSPDAPIPNFEPHRRKHISDAKIRRGRSVYAANRARLSAIERETGVPGELMVSIYGNETDYGTFTGDFDLIRALASLAYDGRRRSLFEPELIASLKMLDQGVPRARLVGSYAGATGYPQFLPSVYLRAARDGDGDGRADIWSSEADAFASIANYFVQAGWRRGEPWGIAVAVPASLDRGRIANRTIPARCPRVFDRHSRWLSMAEWRALGIVPVGGTTLADTTMATLLEPDGQGRTAYLLTSNYRVLLDYNCSNFYALTVGLLANAIAY